MNKTPEDFAHAAVRMELIRVGHDRDDRDYTILIGGVPVATETGAWHRDLVNRIRTALIPHFVQATEQGRQEATRHHLMAGIDARRLERMREYLPEEIERQWASSDADRLVDEKRDLLAHIDHLDTLLACCCRDEPDRVAMYQQGVEAGILLMRKKTLETIASRGASDGAIPPWTHELMKAIETLELTDGDQ